MKTIICVFGDNTFGKHYSFNINADGVKVGDKIKTDAYKQHLTVVKVEQNVFTNFDYKTGRLGEGSGVIKILPDESEIITT